MSLKSGPGWSDVFSKDSHCSLCEKALGMLPGGVQNRGVTKGGAGAH